ncbi:MAG: hybrid sensor histidine kinase/response regulator [Rhodomicrobium sp.]
MLNEGEGLARPEPGEAVPLERQLEKLSRINAVLMDRVERSMDQQGSAYSLFQTAIALEAKVRSRTEELTAVLRRLERTNDALVLAKEEAERANRSKTRFLAAASHDLLQPLNAAKLSISVLGDMQTGPEARALAGKVEGALQTIEDLIKTLLDISKLDAGVVKPEFRPVVLCETLTALAGSFDAVAAAKGLRLRTRQTRLLIESDPVLLSRVLQNLVSNAIHYTARGGVLIGARRRDGTCFIDVTDTGTGIAADERERVFDEFYRGAASAGGEHAGLGLGLAIVRRTVQALGAQLAVFSHPGRGSTFRLIVPCLGEASARASCDPPAATWPAAGDSIAGSTVLIVEDDRNVLEAMVNLFERWSCRTFTVRNPEDIDALLPTLDRLPAIIIADYHLGGEQTGLAAIAKLRKLDAGLPALVVTADYSEETAARIRGAGCEMLQKPVKPAELRALIAHLLTDKPVG